MENSKDISKNSSGQIQGQLTQANHTVNVLKSVNDFDEISQEISYSFLCKKTEKLATALYLITSFLSDNEPIKWSVRSSGISVLSDVTDLGNAVVSEMSQKVKKIMSDIEKTVSLLEIASTAGFISEMNLTILREEYLSLVQTLGTRKKGGLQESFVFSRDFFSVRSVLKKETEENYKGHIKDTNIYDVDKTESSFSNQVSFGTQSSFPRRHESMSPVIVPDTNSNQRYPSNRVGITTNTPKKQEMISRKDVVVKLIKEKGNGGEISIKDITAHFTDCGEKTIQRELLTLVASGVLKKTGDRRWSKYSLV